MWVIGNPKYFSLSQIMLKCNTGIHHTFISEQPFQISHNNKKKKMIALLDKA